MIIRAVVVSDGDTAHIRTLDPPIEFDAAQVTGFKMVVDPEGTIEIRLETILD